MAYEYMDPVIITPLAPLGASPEQAEVAAKLDMAYVGLMQDAKRFRIESDSLFDALFHPKKPQFLGGGVSGSTIGGGSGSFQVADSGTGVPALASMNSQDFNSFLASGALPLNTPDTVSSGTAYALADQTSSSADMIFGSDGDSAA